MIGSRPIARIVLMMIFGLVFAGMLPGISRACDRNSDCLIGNRSYRIILPEGHDNVTSIPAIIFVHSYRGTAAGVMGNDKLTKMATQSGFAFIAVQAAGPEWNIPSIPSGDELADIDELAYFDAVSEEISRKFAIDPSRVIVAGFSSGAMMVWYLACHRGNSYAGFVPMSGTFWEPLPTTCPTIPSNLIHYHGRQDPVVPLGGRQIKDAHQGDVMQAIELVAGLSDYMPATPERVDGAECSRQVDDRHRILELCLFTGKHEMKVAYLARAMLAIEESGFHQ